MKTKRALFISFEGIDGSGKSTQVKMLYHYLLNEGYVVHLFREPGGTSISEKIRSILLDKNNVEMTPIAEVLLYFASRNQLLHEKVLPALERGEIVLMDRYVDSSRAYQGVGRALGARPLNYLTKFATYDRKPELTILVDLPLETAEDRLSEKNLDRFESESMQFKRKVRSGYLNLAKKEPSRYLVVDGRASPDDLFRQIKLRVQELLD
ncbi:MAG: dTMP kinase [Lentisphaeria bacterium]|nr:dTMP kinase [Candidatus Neomarinimicrobiota bacterium]MCF7842673.1 dTMP kinase [Lentisphaeria bacterium]